MKYVIDIDGTICTSVLTGNYEESIPISSHIDKINKLYDEGHQITYFTARGMGRYGGNIFLAEENFYEFTSNQLNEWRCKYHKLILGKPSGDYYIDDKAINSHEFFKN